jgi:hypothetical protein
VEVIRQGKKAETVAGDRFTLQTSVNETLAFIATGHE